MENFRKTLRRSWACWCTCLFSSFPAFLALPRPKILRNYPAWYISTHLCRWLNFFFYSLAISNTHPTNTKPYTLNTPSTAYPLSHTRSWAQCVWPLHGSYYQDKAELILPNQLPTHSAARQQLARPDFEALTISSNHAILRWARESFHLQSNNS